MNRDARLNDNLDLRDLALTIAKAHDLTLTAMQSAYEVSENDEDFLTAICASADVEEMLKSP